MAKNKRTGTATVSNSPAIETLTLLDDVLEALGKSNAGLIEGAEGFTSEDYSITKHVCMAKASHDIGALIDKGVIAFNGWQYRTNRVGTKKRVPAYVIVKKKQAENP